MQTYKLITGTFPSGLANLVASYVIAPANTMATVIGIYACIEQCEKETDSTRCVSGAAYAGADLVVHRLIDLGADGQTALLAACAGGHVTLIQSLIMRGIPLMLTMLFNAVMEGHADAVRALMHGGMTPDDAADVFVGLCNMEETKHVALLLDAGADASRCIVAACATGDPNLVNIVLNRGAQWPANVSNRCAGNSLKVAHLMVSSGQWSADDGLLHACMAGNVHAICEAVEAGATMTHAYANIVGRSGDASATNHVLTHWPGFGADILHGACATGHTLIIEQIMNCGQYVEQTYRSCFRTAISYDQPDAADLLIARQPIGSEIVVTLTAALGAPRTLTRMLDQFPQADRNIAFAMACHEAHRPPTEDNLNPDYAGVMRILRINGATHCLSCHAPVDAHFG